MTQEQSDGIGADGDPAPHTNRPLLVVPDTNVLTSNHLLQTAAGSALADILSRGNGRILLPEVVELEIKNVLGRKLVEDAQRAAARVEGLEAIIQKKILHLPDTTTMNAAIEQRLAELEPLMLREPFSFEIAQAALMRVIEKRPPSGSNNEQFRDCCIWEHCLRLGKSYEVHLVTADGDFYEARKPENGLAEQLRSELKSQNASVVAYPTLPKCVERLSPSVPPLDAEHLGRIIGEAARHTLEPRADMAGFILSDLTHSRVSVITTKMPLNLLATFDLSYSLIEKAEQDAQVRLNPELTASGSCALTGPERSIGDLRLDESTIRWTDLSGKIVTQRHHYLYPGTAFFGVGGT